ncbi:hypothetical protein PORY_001121 [Pneumocystis oryctolagi]|uniref:Uncharacterized protein n=1 Tax=Pneumocystis oryctolagi TaxID=42067 RepID=A0ACB7CDW7_9ASCO|nr:hypothetical protein PORY_001121 [Pneumocystis oryctolagi]
MVLDYSKWDKLELSDDSDIEGLKAPEVKKCTEITCIVHPNVDKRSFIRWKQRDIHEKRQARKKAIQDITLNRKMNTDLIEQISRSIESLKNATDQYPDDIIADILNKIKQENIPNIEGAMKYHVSIGTLVEQVKETLGTLEGEERRIGFIREFEKNAEKLQNLVDKADEDLRKLEEEGKGKITSEDIRVGFESSSITKLPTTKKKEKIQTVEILNEKTIAEKKNSEDVSLSENNSNTEDENTEHIEPSNAGREFSKLDSRNYHALLHVYLHCFSSLTKTRVTSANHAAHKLFNDDVEQTYSRIKVRAAEIQEEREASSGVEQIQLHAVDPNTKITISIPPSDASDPETQEARRIFDSFSPELQAALQSGQLENINKVLASVPLQEAEKIVSDLKHGGLLSIEDEVIDATQGTFSIDQIHSHSPPLNNPPQQT